MANTAPISNTIATRAGSGIPGEITRRLESTIESILLDTATDTPDEFGRAVKIVSGKARKFVSGDVAADIDGLLVRTEPAITEADGAPKENAVHGLLVEGYVSIVCAVGTPARTGIVYVRTVADTGKLVGDFEATFDDGGEGPDANEIVPGWVWAVDGKDSDNVAEVRIG